MTGAALVPRDAGGPPVTLAFLIFPGFPMACLTSMIEPLRAANEICGAARFRWTILSEDGGRVASSAGVGFDPDARLAEAEGPDLLFLLSSPAARFANPVAGEGRLRRLARHGARLGAISGGVFPLARSGLAQGRMLSVHWCYEAAFAAEFPHIRRSADLVVSDMGLETASGAAAAFDMMLALIERRLGARVATEVACWFQHPLVRGAGVRQRIPTVRGDGHGGSHDGGDMGGGGDALPPLVAKAALIFADNISAPIDVAAVAARVGVSPRHLARQFKAATGQGPLRHYRAMRMRAARQLVLHTNGALTAIAGEVGYDTAASLSRHYRAAFGIGPLEERKKINGFRVTGNHPLPSA